MTHGHAPLGERVIGIEIEQLRMIFRFCYINSREKSNGKTAFGHGDICFAVLNRNQRKVVKPVFRDDLADILTYFLTGNTGDQGLVFQMMKRKFLGIFDGIFFRRATRLARGWDREIMKSRGARARTLTKRLEATSAPEATSTDRSSSPFSIRDRRWIWISSVRDSSTSGYSLWSMGKTFSARKGLVMEPAPILRVCFWGSKREERSFEKRDSNPFKLAIYWKNSSPAGVGDRIPLFRIKSGVPSSFSSPGEKTA